MRNLLPPRLLHKLESLGILKYFNFTYQLPSGLVSKIPIVNGWGLNHLSDKEPWFGLLLSNYPRYLKGKIFVDCGVNIGQTLIKVKNLDPNIKYVGFEPNPLCVYYTSKLMEVNKILEASIFPVGISNENTISELYLNEHNSIDTNASMIDGFRQGEFKRVKAVFLNPCLLNIWKHEIGYLKIDVEGSELEVLKGFKDLILRDKPLIICEILPVYTQTNSTRLERQNELLDLITTWEYSIFRINVTDASLSRITNIEIHKDLNKSNYLFIPNKAHNKEE